MAATNPQIITGNWSKGIALDLHTLSSVKVGVNEAGHDVFDTTRSELGQLLYRLKYSGDLQVAQDIIDTASAYLQPSLAKFKPHRPGSAISSTRRPARYYHCQWDWRKVTTPSAPMHYDDTPDCPVEGSNRSRCPSGAT